ncbi:SubName: Full=Uncharacterized protein {ECO:0000313/EMBL:CCA68474.1} [Serendipita indica DSM 11827]|nr:SubName: Full=Uncharacterized protein {ECO:0000313/EMBL:CCA68474.1} [Serendipita indica DSM 11827]
MASPSTAASSDAPVADVDSKPAERFLIGVLLGLFAILCICGIFLVRPVVLRVIRNLRNQQDAVEQIIQQRRRRARKPKLLEVYVDPRAQTDAAYWHSQQPFGLSVDYTEPDPPQYAKDEARTGSRTDSTLPESNGVCKGDDLNTPRSEDSSSPSDEQPSPPCPRPEPSSPPPLEQLDTIAQICVFVAMPSPSRSVRYQFPPTSPSPHPTAHSSQNSPRSTPSHLELDKIRDRGDTPCSASTLEDDRLIVPPPLPCLALGIGSSPLTLYQ